MAKTDIWMPIIIGDFLKDTMHLNSDEQGFYLLVLLHLWNNEGYLTKEKLRKTLKLSPKKFDKKMSKIYDFFVCFSGELFQKRLVFEYEKSTNNRKIKSESGKLGGRGKSKKKPNGFFKKTSSPSPSSIKKNSSTVPSKRKPNQIWDCICDLFNLNPVTPQECKELGRISSDFRLKGANPTRIKQLHDEFRRVWPKVTCTHRALLKNYDFLKNSITEGNNDADY